MESKDKKEKIYKAPFYDSSTQASNPGRMSLNFIQWTKMNFPAIAEKTIVLVVSLILAIKLHWIFYAVFVGSLLYNIWYWFGVRNTFQAGDVNPGKVISLNPDKVAVATNMTKMFGDYPILKIVKTKLPKFEKKIGMYIPTAALYNDNPYDYPFWSEFHPVPISHGTTDKGIMKDRFETFSTEDFVLIDTYLEQIDSTKVGTYKVNIATSGWKDYPNVVVGNLNKMKGPEKEEKS